MAPTGHGGTERGGSPLPLDDATQAWLVVEGSIDVFAVPSLEGGDGPRRHLWSAEPGDVIPPAPRPPGARFVLTAVGMGTTRLRSLPVSALGDVALAPAIDRLVANLTPLLSWGSHGSDGSHVALHEILSPGHEFLLQQGQRAGIRESTVWIRHLEGSTRIGARPHLELGPGRGWVPLHGVWIVAAAGDVRLETLDTREVLRQGGDASGLLVLVELVQSCLTEGIEAEESQDRELLRAKSVFDRKIWQSALGRLASVLRPGKAEHEPVAARYPLLAACRAVGAAAGIQFREPQLWEVERTRDLLHAICRVSRVRSRRVALRGSWWQSDAGPLLGTTQEGDNPVALLPAGASRYVILDPRDGLQRPVTAAVAAELRPFGVTFTRSLPDSARSVRDLLSFAMPLVRADVARIAMAALLGGLLTLALPVATAHIFNQVIPNARPRDLVTVLVALSAAALGSAFFDIARAFSLTRTEGRVSAATQAALVDRLLALPVPFFRRFAVGDLAQRANAIHAAQEQIGTSTLTVLLASAFSAVNLIVLFALDGRLALLALALLVVAGAIYALMVRTTLRHERLQESAQARVAGLVFQMISGISKLKVAGAEARAFAFWSHAFARQRELAQRASHSRAVLTVFNEVLPVACTAALFAGGGWLMFQQGQTLPTGDFVAFASAFGALFAAAVALSNTGVSLVSAVTLLERTSPILETSPEVTDAHGDPGALRGLIEGAHLTFRYHPDGPIVLDDLSFRAEPGQFVAFVGPSGSGKSTTLRMLLGFETPETGAVYYDGQDLSSLDISAIRNQQLGVVLQNSRLMAGDIFANIVGAASKLTLEDAWEAAEAAGLADDIRDMPMGMHTLISEGGSTFSGGQRQRLLIARALVRKPRIILFDEATSALDNRTQMTVTRTLELSSATRFVIAHRLSTIRKADRIYVMDRGRVAEEGSFDELARGRGLFSRLIARQQA